MVNLLVIYDVAHHPVRARLEALLEAHGFVHVFRNVMRGSCPTARRAQVCRNLHRRLLPHPHRVLMLHLTPHQLRQARWLIGPARLEAAHAFTYRRVVSRLAVRLLASLEEESESPEAIEKLWLAEAERRFQELRDRVVQGVPAREVFEQLRAKLSS